MISLQTSIGTLLMFLVEEKIGAAAVDEDDEVALVFCRLAGGAVAALLVPFVCSVLLVENFWQMCSFQTSTGTLLMHLVVEKIGATAVDEDDEVALVFWRLAGGAVAALLVPVVCSISLVDIF